jgi:hypothetical protein
MYSYSGYVLKGGMGHKKKSSPAEINEPTTIYSHNVSAFRGSDDFRGSDGFRGSDH